MSALPVVVVGPDMTYDSIARDMSGKLCNAQGSCRIVAIELAGSSAEARVLNTIRIWI